MIAVLERLRRKVYSTARASSDPQIAEFCTELIDWRMKSLWSTTTVSWRSSRSSLMRSASRRTAAATATVLAPLCFWTPTLIAGTPFISTR